MSRRSCGDMFFSGHTIIYAVALLTSITYSIHPILTGISVVQVGEVDDRSDDGGEVGGGSRLLLVVHTGGTVLAGGQLPLHDRHCCLGICGVYPLVDVSPGVGVGTAGRGSISIQQKQQQQ